MSDEDTKYWIYAGGLPYELTEGDIVCVFSQYGEIFEISLSRDRDTGKSRGFCFIKYEDPRSCELAVDNFHGATIIGRKIKVSFANNTNAVKSRKAAIVAPQEPAANNETQQREYDRYDRRDSPKSEERVSNDYKKRKYRDETVNSNDVKKYSKHEDHYRGTRDTSRYRGLGDRLEDSRYRKNHHYDSDDRHRHRESADRHRLRDSRDSDRHRRSSRDRESHRDSRQSSDYKSQRRESDDKSRHRDSDRRHRHRESDDKSRHRESDDKDRSRDLDHKHKHSKHRHSSSDRKTHN